MISSEAEYKNKRDAKTEEFDGTTSRHQYNRHRTFESYFNKLESEKLHNGGANAGVIKNEEFVAKARSNSMGDLRAIFGDVMMRVLAAILSDSGDMYAKFNENPDAYMRIMNNDLPPIVYRRCNDTGK